MTTDSEARIRNCIPAETLFLHTDTTMGRMIELKDGRLLNFVGGQIGKFDGHLLKSISSDGGATWTTTEPLMDIDGQPIEGAIPGPLRLKSGGLGLAFSINRGEGRSRYGLSIHFTRSDDEGQTWTKPVKVSESYNNAWMGGYGPPGTVTSNGSIVLPVHALIGQQMIDRARAPLGDGWAQVGAHGWENFLSYNSSYHSDDEGQTWQPNTGKGVWGAGGELFVTIDHTLGGHHGCEEPVVEEVSPNLLLMLHRTALGRFYQSWSNDDGKTWTQPEPTGIAAAQTPASLKRIPGTSDLLLIWNQASADEIQRGRQRHRLSTAISKDGGVTWRHGRNIFFPSGADPLEVTRIEPPPDIRCYRAWEHAPRVPLTELRGTYPSVSFWQDRVIIVFKCMERTPWQPDEDGQTQLPGQQTMVCIGLPVSWFYV